MGKLPPLISSGVAGPLGVIHLPRLWSKALLGAKGKLADGYKNCGPGFDHMILNALGLDIEATLEYLTTKLPTYPEFEAWILEQKGGSIDPAVISQVNSAILGYNFSDEIRKQVLEEAGINDDGTILDAVSLNNLDDWGAFHALVTE